MNACIVGYGAIGPVHADALSLIDGANLYAVCDVNNERADLCAKQYGAKPYYDFDECIKDGNIDCVHICTPHYLHFEMITKALDTGKRVVVEKPAVMTKSEWNILLSKYDVSKIFPIVQNRKNTCIQELKKIIDTDKSIGKLKGVKGILTWSRNADYYNSAKWRGTKEYEGGGVLINQAVHTLDLMVYYAGVAKKVNASMRNCSLKDIIEVEDTIDAYIEFQDGAKGIFYATNAYTSNSPMQLEFEFENKSFAYTNGMLISDGQVVCKDSREFRGKKYWGDGHAKALCDFYELGSKFCVADIKPTMDVMFAIYESAKKGKKIIL